MLCLITDGDVKLNIIIVVGYPKIIGLKICSCTILQKNNLSAGQCIIYVRSGVQTPTTKKNHLRLCLRNININVYIL